jgi:hypothetical protein
MTKSDFFKIFVTSECLQKTTTCRNSGTKVKHRMTINGWYVPVLLLTRLKKYLPKETEVDILSPVFDGDNAISFTYPTGSIKLVYEVVKPEKS